MDEIQKCNEAERIISWWKSMDEHQGISYVDNVSKPLLEIYDGDLAGIMTFLESISVDDLEIVSGCFEDIYRKWTTYDVWVALGRLEDKVIAVNCPWKIKAKQAYLEYEDEPTYFDTFMHDDKYIVHGEILIYCFDSEFRKMWDFSARDIWVRQDGCQAVVLHDEYIELYDWLGYSYKLGYDGKEIKDI
ncbi:MAG: hypothetical protein GX567_17440 [Clostridia bacterium]|nr:hypothetical protein [Clostridia bacterium]